MESRWFNKMIKEYEAGLTNVFMLNGNIDDFVVENKMMKEFFQMKCVNKFKRVISYNFSTGGVDIASEGQIINSKENACNWNEIIEMLSTDNYDSEDAKSNRICVLVEYPEFFLSPSLNGNIDEATKKRLIELNELLNNPRFSSSWDMLIFISEYKSALHPMLMSSNSRISTINVEYPNEEERLATIEYLMKEHKGSFELEMSKKELARITAGLSNLHIKDIFLIAGANGLLGKDSIMERKKALIQRQYGELIEVIDTDALTLNDFSGQEHLKKYHMEAVVQPILDGDRDSVPKGLLFTGPPGTGKTYFANCLAGSAKINSIEFKMSKILDKWVGEAEKNLEKAFNCFNSLAPVIVFIDEIDQALSRGNGSESNSIKGNMFGMFLSFLSKPSNRGRILFIGATNYPNLIDEALKRAGRFDKKIPFMLPNKAERIHVMKYHLAKSKLPVSVTDAFYEEMGAKTEQFTPAEIENIIVKTIELYKRGKKKTISDELILEAMKYVRAAKNPKIEEMIDLALKECNDLEFIPKEYIERYEKLIAD